MLQDKGITDRVQKEIGISFNLDIHKVIATYLYAFYEEDPHPNVSKFIERLDDEELQQVVIEIAMLHVIEDINEEEIDRKSTRLNSSHVAISYAVFCLKKKKKKEKMCKI